MRAPDVPLGLRPLAWIAGLMLGLPLVGLIVRAPWTRLISLIRSSDALAALRLSLVTATMATLIATVIGVPLALVLARSHGAWARMVRNLVTVPLVLPPVVGGVALFLVFGRKGFIGSVLYDDFGIQIAFSTTAVVLAELFVAMPFLVVTAAGALAIAPIGQVEAAATLGATPTRALFTITLPSVRPALVSGLVLCWARALGEFGATITFAGYFPNRTTTMPLAISDALNHDPDSAIALSVVLLLVTVAVLVGLRQSWLGGLTGMRAVA